MNEKAENEEVKKEIWARIEHEDKLLSSRTNIVLVLNGLAAVAISQPVAPKGIIVILITIINALWTICAREARKVIFALIYEFNGLGATKSEEIRKRTTRKTIIKHTEAIKKIKLLFKLFLHCKEVEEEYRISPTEFVSEYIPWILLIGWIIGSLLAIVF